VARRKAYPLRIDPDLYAAIERWAADEMRSVNGQIEYLLTQAVRGAGRLGRSPPEQGPAAPPDPEG
jgi:hypothetical protein